MKFLIVLFSLVSSVVHGQETLFENKVYPLLKKSPIHLILFTHFDFHPTFISEHKDEKSHSITALISYSPDKKGSIAWSHFATFHLIRNKENEVLISRIEFRDTGPHSPCFIPEEVISVDGVGKLTKLKVGIDSQPLLPKAKQVLEQLHRDKTKKK